MTHLLEVEFEVRSRIDSIEVRIVLSMHLLQAELTLLGANQELPYWRWPLAILMTPFTGAASAALAMVEAWMAKEGLPEHKPDHVPSWVDALLLVLDQATRLQSPANVQAAKVRKDCSLALVNVLPYAIHLVAKASMPW